MTFKKLTIKAGVRSIYNQALNGDVNGMVFTKKHDSADFLNTLKISESINPSSFARYTALVVGCKESTALRYLREFRAQQRRVING